MAALCVLTSADLLMLSLTSLYLMTPSLCFRMCAVPCVAPWISGGHSQVSVYPLQVSLLALFLLHLCICTPAMGLWVNLFPFVPLSLCLLCQTGHCSAGTLGVGHLLSGLRSCCQPLLTCYESHVEIPSKNQLKTRFGVAWWTFMSFK